MGSVDDTIGELRESDRACLQHVVDVVRAARTDTEDGRSYGLPALLLEGKPLVAVAAAAKHLSLYPFSSAVIDAVAPSLGGFSLSRGTIRFSAANPLPDAVVREIVRLRSLEITGE
jgi:uncharacterized protein YdhG (YjbR/CyaY superfamily)